MKYVGDWLDDKRSGYGTQYDDKEKIISQGVWALNKFIEKAKVGTEIIHSRKAQIKTKVVAEEKNTETPTAIEDLEEIRAREILNKKERFFK